jgi:uncharacterized protein (DUF1800 family)
MKDISIDKTVYSKVEKKFHSKFEKDLYENRKTGIPGTVLDESPIPTLTVEGGLEPYAGPWDDQAVIHFLRRLTYGVKKEDLVRFKNMTLDQAVDEMVRTSPEPEPPKNYYNNNDFTDPNVPFGETWVNEPFSNDAASPRVVSLKKWLIQQMIEQESTIHEKMVQFWHNHLVVQLWDAYMPEASYRHFTMLRRNALGNFKTLMKEMTIDTSMLIYLNGFVNSKEAPDENYARELQELFCIGKGPNANFTEGDVQQAARVLTGWTIQWPDRVSVWNFWAHDTEDKQFSSFYNNTIISGRSGAAGQNELDDLLDMLFDNDETALFICRKIYRYFIYSEISDQAERDVIQPLANILRDNNYEMMPVLKTLFKSAHFFDAEIRSAQIKSPIDFLVGFWRTTNVKIPSHWDKYQEGLVYNTMLWNMSNMGQQVGDPPNVAGFPAYYQTPIYDKSWITTDTITTRALDTDSFIFWGFWTPQENLNVDLIEFVRLFDNPKDPNDLIEEAFMLCCGLTPSERVREQFKNILLSNQATDSYWLDAWVNFEADPSDVNKRNLVESRLRNMFRRLFQLAEYQLA